MFAAKTADMIGVTREAVRGATLRDRENFLICSGTSFSSVRHCTLVSSFQSPLAARLQKIRLNLAGLILVRPFGLSHLPSRRTGQIGRLREISIRR